MSLACAIALAGCDEARSTPPPQPGAASEAGAAGDPPNESGAELEAGAPAPEDGAKPAPVEAPPEPAKPPGPSCDQASRSVCVDYGEGRGAAPPRCAEGVELAEFGCAREGVVARCTLPATGVTIFSYEGREADEIAAECDTIDGQLAQ